MPDIKDMASLMPHPFRAIRNTGYFTQKRGWEWDSNGDYACFYCVTAGTMTLLLGDEVIHGHEGDAFFLRHLDRGARFVADVEDTAYYFISFYYDESTSLGIAPYLKGVAPVDRFKAIHRAHHSEAFLYRLKEAELFLGLVHHLASATADGVEGSSSDARLRAATEYVNIYYYKKISIGDLCAVSNYSPAHLRRLFLKHYALTPQEYIIRKKLAMAKDMLEEAPEKKIDEIAELLSFCSASYLCKLFKKHYGVSILAYKRGAGTE